MDGTGVDIETTEGARKRAPRVSRVVIGAVLCVAGCLVASVMTGLGCALMTAGAWLVCGAKSRGKLLAALCCLVPLAVLCVVSWENLGSYALPGVACSLVLALALPGRIGVTSVCLCILATAGLVAGTDEVVLLGAGSNLLDYVQSSLASLSDQYSAALSAGVSSTSIMLAAAYQNSVDLMRKLWPLMYVSQGAFDVLLGLVGLGIARRIPYERLYASYLRFEVPVWGIIALAVAVAILLGGGLDVPVAPVMESAGMCVLLFLRVLYFLQGLAVSMCLMQRHGVGHLARILVIALLLFVEWSFYAVSVFGAIDFFAHFRGRERETVANQASEDGRGQADDSRALGPGDE